MSLYCTILFLRNWRLQWERERLYAVLPIGWPSKPEMYLLKTYIIIITFNKNKLVNTCTVGCGNAAISLNRLLFGWSLFRHFFACCVVITTTHKHRWWFTIDTKVLNNNIKTQNTYVTIKFFWVCLNSLHNGLEILAWKYPQTKFASFWETPSLIKRNKNEEFGPFSPHCTSSNLKSKIVT